MLEVRNLHTGYEREIIKGVSFDIEPGTITCILGANGCGKTTLLKNIMCFIKPTSGTVRLDGKDVFTMSYTERARRIGYIPQAHVPPFPFSVMDVVMMGRFPYLSKMTKVTSHDEDVAQRVMKRLQIDHLMDRPYTELSGGQRQMVVIARALAQEPDLLVMDEPTNNLDFGNQYILLEQMNSLVENGEMSIVMVTHSPDQALFCADHVLIIKDGLIAADGTAEEVVTEGNMKDIYNTDVRISEIKVDRDRSVTACIAVSGKRRERKRRI